MLNKDFFKIVSNKIVPIKGDVLVAEPFLHGKYFGRSVILITEDSEESSMGLVLNKPLTYDVGDFFPDLDDFDLPVYLGGPVETDKLFFIHTLGNLIPQSIHIKDNLYWGGDFETISKLIKEDQVNSSQIRFFIGYSGWIKGQLEMEIEGGAWLVVNVESNDMMDAIHHSLWEDTMYSLGGKYKIWSKFPENPNMN
ncbi:MAG: YqgE/AlgH family protein [Marinifilaceae bacterium]